MGKNNEERNTTLGQKIGSRIFGMVCGCGASSLIAGILYTVVDATGVGKFGKFLLKAGAWGCGYTAGKHVSDAVSDAAEELFDSINQFRSNRLAAPESAGPVESPMTSNYNA